VAKQLAFQSTRALDLRRTSVDRTSSIAANASPRAEYAKFAYFMGVSRRAAPSETSAENLLEAITANAARDARVPRKRSALLLAQQHPGDVASGSPEALAVP
jgi:hypothetical protein